MRTPWGLAVAAMLAVGVPCQSQAAHGQGTVSFRPAEVVRDPCLQRIWQLVRNPDHPAGPGRWVEVASSLGREQLLESRVAIRAGDRVLVKQSSEWMEAKFGAVALESARVGERLLVRLTTGVSAAPGPVVTVEATAAGAAEWRSERGAGR